MNPWDEKMTYQLSEGELMQYVRHLSVRHDVDVEREDRIRGLVDEAENWWLNNSGQPQWSQPEQFFRASRAHPQNVSALPYADHATYSEIRVRLPEWLPRQYVRFLADQQIREQWPENE
jgi:hypothetical protein